MSAATPAVTDATFVSEVLESNIPVLVDFWAPWCGPCRMVAPILEQLATEKQGQLKIVKLNADENPAVCSQYGIMSLPTLVLFQKGNVVNQMVGFRPKAELVKLLDQSLAVL